MIESATLRMRPILMTTGAMVLGAVPLALATGAGAESRQDIGWVIVGGLLVGTLFTLFVIPVVYTYLASRTVKARRAAPKRRRLPRPSPCPSPSACKPGIASGRGGNGVACAEMHRRTGKQLMRAEIGGDLAAANKIAADHGAAQLVFDEQRQPPAGAPLNSTKQLKRRPCDLILISAG